MVVYLESLISEGSSVMSKPIAIFFVVLTLACRVWGDLTELRVPGTPASGVVSPMVFEVPGHEGAAHYEAKDDDGNSWPVTVLGSRGVLVAPTSKEKRTLALEPAGDEGVRIVEKSNPNRLEVRIRGELFTTFHYGEELAKPYLWPVNAAGGVGITRDWPIGNAVKTKDHPHHVSFYTGYGDVNDADFWEYSDRKGYQRATQVTFRGGAAYGRIVVFLTWSKEDGTPVLIEHRVYTFYNTPDDSRLFDLQSRLMARHGDVKFDDTKEGGMAAVRVHDGLREKGGTGVVTTSEGAVAARAAWGKPAEWCDYSGSLEGIGNVGITIMDHPSSFRFPSHWHVRDYGLMGANAFGYSHFYRATDPDRNGDFLLKDRNYVQFRYRIYVHAGDVEEAQVSKQYEHFKSPLVADLR